MHPKILVVAGILNPPLTGIAVEIRGSQLIR